MSKDDGHIHTMEFGKSSRLKLLGVGFGIVLVLLVLSIILSLVSINNIGHQVELYGKFTVPNSDRLTGMRVNMQGVLFSLLEAITEEDVKYSEEALKTADIRAKEIAVHLDAFRDNSRNNSNVKDIDELSAIITEAEEMWYMTLSTQYWI